MKPSEPLPSAGECPSGKYGFASKHAAQEAVTSQAHKHGHRRRGGVYQCPTCHAWHTTSSAERGGSRKRSTGYGDVHRGHALPADLAFAKLDEMNRARTAGESRSIEPEGQAR